MAPKNEPILLLGYHTTKSQHLYLYLLLRIYSNFTANTLPIFVLLCATFYYADFSRLLWIKETNLNIFSVFCILRI